MLFVLLILIATLLQFLVTGLGLSRMMLHFRLRRRFPEPRSRKPDWPLNFSSARLTFVSRAAAFGDLAYGVIKNFVHIPFDG